MTSLAMPAEATIPGLLLRNASEIGSAPAMREKSMGIWRTLTWSGYLELVRDFSLGLASLGFKRGDVLAVIGDNRPRLYAAQLAAQCLGGMPVPLYQDAAAEELVYVLEHAEASVVIAEDQEQADKILSIRAQLPKLRLVVYEDRIDAAKTEQELSRINTAIAEAAALGWCADVVIDVVEGPSDYLFGEETAMLEVINGRPPFPRIAPPFRRGVVEVVGSRSDAESGDLVSIEGSGLGVHHG